MRKKIAALFFSLLCLGGVYGGWYSYRVAQNTPEQTVQRFMANVTAGETALAYKQLPPELLKGREAYWQAFLKQFAKQAQPSKRTGQELLKDTFAIYPEHSEPQRFTYELRLNDQPYQLVLIVLKVGNTWQINELYGAPGGQL